MIDVERMQHSIAVGRLMRDYCIDNALGVEYGEDMFMLGLLHDIGYEYGDIDTHGDIAYNMLIRQGYRYVNEVRFHGISHPAYQSRELDLLNWADMHIGSNGEYMTFDERLEDIESRRGAESRAYREAVQVVEDLMFKGYM